MYVLICTQLYKSQAKKATKDAKKSNHELEKNSEEEEEAEELVAEDTAGDVTYTDEVESEDDVSFVKEEGRGEEKEKEEEEEEELAEEEDDEDEGEEDLIGEEKNKKREPPVVNYLTDLSQLPELWTSTNTESLGELWFHMLR